MKKLSIKQKIIIVLAIMASVVIALYAVASVLEENPILEPLKLKASKDKILGSREIDWIVRKEDGILENKGKIIKYAYNSGIRTTAVPSDRVIAEAQRQNLIITNELIGKRTKHSKSFVTNDPEKFVSEFISGVPQYYKDSNGEWWQAEYATTTGGGIRNSNKDYFTGQN